MKAATLKRTSELLPMPSADKEKDLRLLHELMPSLSDEGILAIYFRFWERLLIEDIAKILGRSWSETDQLIENSIKQLRNGFLKNQLSTRLLAA
jgi:DNA-directed RNA polymerase specialized sigma subunit